MVRRPTKSTLFPFTALFRSRPLARVPRPHVLHRRGGPPHGPQAHELPGAHPGLQRSEEHTPELQSRLHPVCRLLLEKKKKKKHQITKTRPNTTQSFPVSYST